MFNRFKVLFFIIIFLGTPISRIIWSGEHPTEAVESGKEVEKQMEQKQQELKAQQQKKAEAEADLQKANKQEEEAKARIASYGGYIGTLSWGWSKVWSGEYDKLLQQQEDAKDAQYDAKKKISDAKAEIEQLQKDMITLSQQYTPAVSTESLDDLKSKMGDFLKKGQIDDYNNTLQQLIAKTDNVDDKFAVLTNAIDAVVKAYPNDLTAQSDALAKLELTLHLMFAKDYNLPSYKGTVNNIKVARENVQAKIDERSPWYSALEKKDISIFKESLKNLFNQKKTDEERSLLLRDVFNQVSAKLDVGSTEWFDALNDIFENYALGIETEKAGVDLKQELLFSAIDLVDTKLQAGSDEWRKALNRLYNYDNPLGNREIQKRIESEFKKAEVTMHTSNLTDLLKQGETVDYKIAVSNSVEKLGTTNAKIALIENQYVTAAGQLGVDNYPTQVEVFSVLSDEVNPENFPPADKPKVQETFDKINDRLEILENRLEAGNNNLDDTLKNAGPLAQSKIVGEELFAARQLRNDLADNPKEVYGPQKDFLIGLQEVVGKYESDIVVIEDISNRSIEIENFINSNPQKPAIFINDLDKELELWKFDQEDQINKLKNEYNITIDKLTTVLKEQDTTGIKNIQASFQEIKDLIDEYKLAQKEEGFAKNVDSVLEFANTVFEEYKPVELSEKEKNVLTKLTAGVPINEEEAATLAGIGAKKVLSFVAEKLTPKNLADAGKVADILEKANTIANITGKIMNGISAVLKGPENWVARVLVGGPRLVAGPLVQTVLKIRYGEDTVKTINKVTTETIPNLTKFANSDAFKESAEVLTTGGKVLKSINSLLGGVVQNIKTAADAKKIENIPQKEVLPTYGAVSAISQRLHELGNLEPTLVVEPENVPAEKKGFFAQIQDYFSNFVADVKTWITSLFAGETGIPSLERKFIAAQEAYKSSSTQENVQILVKAAQNLQNAYQELMGSIASYRELADLWDNVMMEADLDKALGEDPKAVNVEMLDEIASVVMQSKAYNAAFMNAMDEISSAVTAASQGTAVQHDYVQLLNRLVKGDYVTKLQNDRQAIQDLNKAFTEYKTNLNTAVAKIKPETTSTDQPPGEEILEEKLELG